MFECEKRGDRKVEFCGKVEGGKVEGEFCGEAKH